MDEVKLHFCYFVAFGQIFYKPCCEIAQPCRIKNLQVFSLEKPQVLAALGKTCRTLQ
jgi:hypothetical protein